jgi:hypothetical protein
MSDRFLSCLLLACDQGFARHTNRAKSPYRGMNGIVIFFSSNDVTSFANLHLWLEDVRR